MKGKLIRSKKTDRHFIVLEQTPERLYVQMVSSLEEEHPSALEPFWLEHEEWEEVTVP